MTQCVVSLRVCVCVFSHLSLLNVVLKYRSWRHVPWGVWCCSSLCVVNSQQSPSQSQTQRGKKLGQRTPALCVFVFVLTAGCSDKRSSSQASRPSIFPFALHFFIQQEKAKGGIQDIYSPRSKQFFIFFLFFTTTHLCAFFIFSESVPFRHLHSLGSIKRGGSESALVSRKHRLTEGWVVSLNLSLPGRGGGG